MLEETVVAQSTVCAVTSVVFDAIWNARMDQDEEHRHYPTDGRCCETGKCCMQAST